MIKCTKCKIEYPLEGFYKDKSSSLGRRSECKECTKKRIRGHRDGHRQAIIDFYGVQLKCNHCGLIDDFCVYDFHHTDPTLKDLNIARIMDKTNGREMLLNELSKCIVLCSNCHRKLHYAKNKTS